MPKYDITDTQTGDTLTIDAEREPSQQDVDEIFSQNRTPRAAPIPTPQTVEQLDRESQKAALRKQSEQVAGEDSAAKWLAKQNVSAAGMGNALAQEAVKGVGELGQGVATLQEEVVPLTMPFGPGIPIPMSKAANEAVMARLQRTPLEHIQDIQSNPLYQKSKEVIEAAPETYPIPEREKEAFLTKAAGTAGSFLPMMAAGPAAPLEIGLQSAGSHIDSAYDEMVKKGATPNQAADYALKVAAASGIGQTALWAIAPKFLRQATDKWIVDKFAPEMGEKVVKRFLVGRAAQTAEMGTLGAASAGGEAAITGQPVLPAMAQGAVGLGAIGLLTPRGRTRLEQEAHDAFGTDRKAEPTEGELRYMNLKAASLLAGGRAGGPGAETEMVRTSPEVLEPHRTPFILPKDRPPLPTPGAQPVEGAQNAVQIRSPTTPVMGQKPESSPEVGGQVRDTQEPAVPPAQEEGQTPPIEPQALAPAAPIQGQSFDMGAGTEVSTPPPEPPAATTAIDPKTVPVVEVPLSKIKLSEDVPNFKSNANKQTGVVEGERLEGKYQRTGTAPVVLWERSNGDLEIITGRHRLDLARRTGEKTIPSQIVRESEGFTKAQALTFDAEANIRDGQGEIPDYATYFKGTDISETEARARGLLSRAKGKAGWLLGKNASDDLYALWRAGKIPESSAVVIARVAPGDQAAQQLGIKLALAGKDNDFIRARLEREQAQQTLSTQTDMFGNTEFKQGDSDAEAQAVADMRGEISAVVRAGTGAAKNPALAKTLDIDVKNPQAVLKRLAELRDKRARLDGQWWLDKELMTEIKARVGTTAKAPPLPKGKTPITIQRPDGTTYQAGFDGWQIINPQGEHAESISRLAPDGKTWSSGSRLAEGEKIVGGDVPAKPEPKPLTPEKPAGSKGDPNIGRTWNSPYGKQTIVRVEKFGGRDNYVVSTEGTGAERVYSADRIDEIVKRNEHELTSEYAKEVADAKETARLREERDARQREKQAQTDSEISEFSKGKSPMVSGKIKKTLLAQVNWSGSINTRKAAIESEIANGAKVERVDGKRQLTKPGGTFFDESATTVAGMDYAEYLQNKKPAAAPAPAPTPPFDLPVVKQKLTENMAGRTMNVPEADLDKPSAHLDLVLGKGKATYQQLIDAGILEKTTPGAPANPGEVGIRVKAETPKLESKPKLTDAEKAELGKLAVRDRANRDATGRGEQGDPLTPQEQRRYEELTAKAGQGSLFDVDQTVADNAKLKDEAELRNLQQKLDEAKHQLNLAMDNWNKAPAGSKFEKIARDWEKAVQDFQNQIVDVQRRLKGESKPEQKPEEDLFNQPAKPAKPAAPDTSAMRQQLTDAENSLRLAESEKQPRLLKDREALNIRIQQLRDKVDRLKSDMTEGQGEIIHRTPIYENEVTGERESQEFRLRQLTRDQANEAFPDPGMMYRETGSYSLPWVAESRRMYYDANGKEVRRDPWYRETYKASRDEAFKQATTYSGRTAKVWKQLYEEAAQKVEKPAAPDLPPPLPPDQQASIVAAQGPVAPVGTQTDGWIKHTDGRWYRMDDEGKLPMKPNGKPNRIPANGKQRAQLEASSAAGPQEADPRSPVEIINQAQKVKVKLPEGGTVLRGYTKDGKYSQVFIADINKNNSFFDAGIVRLEAGRIIDNKFKALPGDVKVEEVRPPKRPDEPAANLGTGLAEGQGSNEAEIRAGIQGVDTAGVGVEVVTKAQAIALTGKTEAAGYGGFVWQGKIYLVADNIRKGTLDGLHALLREEVGHALLRTPAGLKMLSDLLAAGKLALTDAERKSLLDMGYQEHQLLDEFIAKSARENLPWWTKAVERVREWLAKAGLANLTNEEMARILLRKIRSKVDADHPFGDAITVEEANPKISPGLARSPEEYDKFKELGEKAMSIRTVGAYGDVARLKLQEADSMGLSERARRLLNLPRQMEMYSTAASESAGIENYMQARDAVKDQSPHIRWNVTKDALQSLGYEQRRSIKLEQRLKGQAELIDSDLFQRDLERLAQSDVVKTLAERKEEVFRNVISTKIGQFMEQIKKFKGDQSRVDQIRSDLDQARGLLGYTMAISQQMDNIVSSTYKELREFGRGGYWDSQREQPGGKSGEQFFKLYTDARARAGNPLVERQEIALARLASEILGVNSSLTEQLVWAEAWKREPDFGKAIQDFGKSLAINLRADPVAAMKQLISREGKLSQRAADTRRAFLSLNRRVMRELNEYSDLEQAVTVDRRLKASLEWRSLVNTVAADAGQVRIPDAVMEQVKNGNVFNEFTGRLEKMSPFPDRPGHIIDLNWTKENSAKAQEGLQRYLGEIREWMNDPKNADSPDMNYWEREHDFVDAVYNTAAVLNPGSVKSLGVTHSWTMPEFFFRQAAIPASKVTQTAFENWHRAWLIGDQWSRATEQPMLRLLSKAASDHKFDVSLGLQEYREKVLNPLAWEYRHGRAVKAGENLMGVTILPSDIAALKMMGRAFNDLLTKQKNLGAGRVMQKELLFDEWAKGVFAVRAPQEFGAELGTTVPREFSLPARALSTRVADIAPNDFAKLKDIFNSEQYFEPFVMRWLGQRSADFSKVTPFEDLFKTIVQNFNEKNADAPRSVEDIVDFIDRNTDETYTPDMIQQAVVGGMSDELRNFYTKFVKKDPNDFSDIRVVRATHDGPFTQGFQKDVGNSFYYDFGMANAQEVRSSAIDAGMYHMVRFARSLDSLEQEYRRALLDLTETIGRPDARRALMRKHRELYRTGDDFRDFTVLQQQLNEVKYYRSRLPIFSGQDVAVYESMRNLYRLIGDEVGLKLSGWKTLARVLTGSVVKQGFVFGAVDRFYALSYAKAAVSMGMSAFNIALRGSATMLARRVGLAKEFEGNLSGIAEELFRSGKYFDQQYQYGLGTKTPTLDTVLNNLRAPYSHGRGYDPRLSNIWALRIPQKGLYRLLSLVEAPVEAVRTIFPGLGYAIAYDSVARQMYWNIKILESQARHSFDTHEKLGTLTKFDLANPKNVKNVLPADQILPRGLFPRTQTEVNLIREMFKRGTDVDLNDAVLRFWSKLAATPEAERRNVHLLSADAGSPEEALKLETERSGALASVGLFDIHHASPANRMWAMRSGSAGRLVFPIMGWFAQSTRQIFALLGRAPHDPEMSAAMLTAMTTVTVLGALGMSTVLGDTEKRIFAKLSWLIEHKIDPVRHLGQGRNAKEEAQIAASDATSYITVLNSMFNSILGEQSNRGQMGAQVLVTEEINSWLSYLSGVAHTKNPVYGLTSLAAREAPLTKVITSRMPSNEGLTNERNVKTIIQRYAPNELLRQQQGGYGMSTPTELSPLKEKLANAIYRGDSIGVAENYEEFRQKAAELGRTDPDRLAAEVLRSLNPYSLALTGHPSEEQRAKMLAMLDPQERQILLDAETKYLAAAQSVGVKSEMVRAERGTGGGSGGASSTSSTGSSGGYSSIGTGGSGGTGSGTLPGLRSGRLTLGSGRLSGGVRGRRATTRRLSLSTAKAHAPRLVSGRLRASSGRTKRYGRLRSQIAKSHKRKLSIV